MTDFPVHQDVAQIQALLAQQNCSAVYDQYAPVLRDMLFLENREEWLDYVSQGGVLEEEPLTLYLSAHRGYSLLLGCYEGDVTARVLDFLRSKLPEAVWARLSALGRPIVVDIDEPGGELEQQLEPYQEILTADALSFRIDFEDVYCAGAYFLSLSAC